MKAKVFALYALAALVLALSVILSHEGLDFSMLFFLWGDEESPDALIGQLRLTRGLTAMGVGGSLALAGLSMQTVLRNDLAEPYLLGPSAGAGLGAVLALGLNGSWWSLQLGSLVGAFFALGVCVFFTSFLSYHRSLGLILIGIGVSYFCSSATMLLLLQENPELHRGYLFWLLGSVSYATLEQSLWLLFFALVASFYLWSKHKTLDALVIGEEQAYYWGISTRKEERNLLIGVAVLTALSISFCGAIGFVGLVIPHMGRIFMGPSHRNLSLVLLPLGGTFLLLLDTLGRCWSEPQELPLGVLTGFVGVPVLILLLWRQQKRWSQ